MKKILSILCFALLTSLLLSTGAYAMVDGSAYSVTGDIFPETNIPDGEVESRSNKESEGALERAYESAKDMAQTAGRDAMTEVEKAAEEAKDVTEGSPARTVGIIITIIAAVAVIAVVIAVASKKNSGGSDRRDKDERRK